MASVIKPVPEVSLEVNGNRFLGWTRASINLSLDTVIGNFRLGYTDIWRDDSEPMPISEGDRCELFIAGESLLEGYVDRAVPRYSADDHAIDIEGRSLSGDLAECSTATTIQRFRGRTAPQICATVLEPYGLEVEDEATESPPLRAYTVNPGTPALSTIRDVCERRGLIAIERAGKIAITRIAAEPTASILGVRRSGAGWANEHSLSGTKVGDWGRRHSEYRYRGQTQGVDGLSGDAATHMEGAVVDEALVAKGRYRPLVVTSGRGHGASDQVDLATFERNRRAGESERVSYQADDWYAAEGVLWRPNLYVMVHDDWLRIREPMVVSGVSYYIDPGDGGRGGDFGCRVELARPEAYSVNKYPVHPPQVRWEVESA